MPFTLSSKNTCPPNVHLTTRRDLQWILQISDDTWNCLSATLTLVCADPALSLANIAARTAFCEDMRDRIQAAVSGQKLDKYFSSVAAQHRPYVACKSLVHLPHAQSKQLTLKQVGVVGVEGQGAAAWIRDMVDARLRVIVEHGLREGVPPGVGVVKAAASEAVKAAELTISDATTSAKSKNSSLTSVEKRALRFRLCDLFDPCGAAVASVEEQDSSQR
jgi:hypothetical protein